MGACFSYPVILKTKTKISSNGYNPYLINTSILEIWTWLVSPFMSMSIIATWVLNPLSLCQMIMNKGFLTAIQIDIMISCPNTVK